MNLQRIKKFVRKSDATVPCEKSGGLHLAEAGLMAGRQAGRVANKIWARLEILKTCCRPKYSIFRFI